MSRYLLYFAAAVSIALGPAALLSYLFEPIDGDLTRVGGYAERDFGWNGSQPVINIRANGATDDRPGILVLGDSFAKENVWQSVLEEKLQKRILSFHYAQVGCVNNWVEYALSQSSADTVAIEVIERGFVERFADLAACHYPTPSPFAVSTGKSVTQRTTWPPEFHVFHTLRTAVNTLRAYLSPESAVRGKGINAPIDRLCAKFSNRRRDRILYFSDDEAKLHWKREEQMRAVANVMRIQNLFAARGKKLIFIIVPDKLSVYQHCLTNDPDGEARKQINVTGLLIQAGGNTPDLLDAFQEHSGKVTDLYYPNNTHLSANGYILLAEKLLPFFTDESSIAPSSH